jgi:hypothetical protein
MDATNDQQLMGYKLLITLRHPSANYTDTSIEKKSSTESIVLTGTSPPAEKPIDEKENGFTITNPPNEETALTQTASIPDKKPQDITPETLLFQQLADVFLKDLKNRVAGPSIHDFLKCARAARLEQENASEDTVNDFVKIESKGPSHQQKIIESLVNSSSKLPRFKKKPPKRDYESFVSQQEHVSVRAATPASSSEEGEYHSGPEQEEPAYETAIPTSALVHSPSSSPPPLPAARNLVLENRPRGLRDYISDEETDVDEHDAFLKQLHRQEEFNEDESESDDFVENDYQERKRKRTSKPAIKKQKKQFYSDEDTSEYDSTKLKKQKKKQVRKKKKQDSFAPALPERIYEVIEEDISRDSSSSGMDEEDEYEEEEEIQLKPEIDQEELERSLLAPEESDSEELKEPQLQATDPPEWDPFNQIEDPEDYYFLRAALLDRAGIEPKGNFP